MARYNIPGIFTTVTDNSYAQPIELGGRSILIAGFSKYGHDGFHEFSSFQNMKFALGEQDIKKYGLCQFFAEGAFTKTRNVIFKRLLPQDATYSNLIFKKDSTESEIGVVDTEVFINSVIQADATTSAIISARSKGEGYNNIYISFQPAPEVDKAYTDTNGDIKYRFNFLKVSIYEEGKTGPVGISTPFIVSLIDVDPDTNIPITDTLTAAELFIDKKVQNSNEFINFNTNPDTIDNYKEQLNIVSLAGDNRLILKDQITGRNIELIVNDEGIIEGHSTSLVGKDAEYILYSDIDGGGNVTSTTMKLTVSNGSLNELQPEYNTVDAKESFYLDGEDSFWKLTADGTTINLNRYNNDRSNAWTKLTERVHKLRNGTSGENLNPGGKLNMLGNGEQGKENAKQLLVNFYQNNEEIREVLYPELDFDYVPDWTQDLDVMTSIVNFADEIGITMPIVSFPWSQSSATDSKLRKEDLYFSSYNSMIYSGQTNTNHYNATTGQIIACPSSYYAMINHLTIDNEISITEPVANKVKGSLPTAGAKLSYTAKSPDIAKLRAQQINTIIKETAGIYFIDQLTAYKNASKLSRANVVKVIHRMRKDIPGRLKDLLQLKSIQNITNLAESRVREYMDKWLASPDNLKDGIFEKIEINSLFISEEFKLIVSVAVTPIGTIETIEIPISVY